MVANISGAQSWLFNNKDGKLLKAADEGTQVNIGNQTGRGESKALQ